eukprot:6193246-Pleurochrysis_carterae.AAC.1
MGSLVHSRESGSGSHDLKRIGGVAAVAIGESRGFLPLRAFSFRRVGVGSCELVGASAFGRVGPHA